MLAGWGAVVLVFVLVVGRTVVFVLTVVRLTCTTAARGPLDNLDGGADFAAVLLPLLPLLMGREARV
jgi:hypothetical protein